MRNTYLGKCPICGRVKGNIGLDSLQGLTVQTSNGEALDFRAVGTLDNARDEDLVRAATNCAELTVWPEWQNRAGRPFCSGTEHKPLLPKVIPREQIGRGPSDQNHTNICFIMCFGSDEESDDTLDKHCIVT